jgi:hypothetical protein
MFTDSCSFTCMASCCHLYMTAISFSRRIQLLTQVCELRSFSNCMYCWELSATVSVLTECAMCLCIYVHNNGWRKFLTFSPPPFLFLGSNFTSEVWCIIKKKKTFFLVTATIICVSFLDLAREDVFSYTTGRFWNSRDKHT